MTYSVEIINLVIKSFIDKIKVVEIHKRYNISINTIYQWKKIYKDFIVTRTFLTHKLANTQIHKSNKIHYYSNQVTDYVNNNNGCTLNQIKENATNNQLSKSSICRLLKMNNISRKIIQNRIVCKNINKINQDRTEYSNNLNNSDFTNYISIDESSFCIDDVNRYGYSKKSCQIKKIIKHNHNKERYSLLAAISNTQIVAYVIFKGTLDASGYLNFITDNLDKFRDKVILQDNVRLHHSKKVKEYANENNINLKYIPAYTPEFNPIEQMFSQVKTHFRKLNHNNLIIDIEESLLIVRQEHLTNYYNNTLREVDKYRSI
jgi:transposase